MLKITEITYVQADDIPALTEKMDRKIQEGFQPYNGIHEPKGALYKYYQQLVRYEEPRLGALESLQG